MYGCSLAGCSGMVFQAIFLTLLASGIVPMVGFGILASRRRSTGNTAYEQGDEPLNVKHSTESDQRRAA